jgi:hypothetical protein
MNRMKALFFPDVLVLFDPDGDRHAEAGHAVEDIASDLRLGLLIWRSPGVKASADDGFVSVHCRFDSAPPGISRTPLPADAAMPCNRLEMHVALRRRGLARNGRRSKRDDDSGPRLTFRHRIVNRLPVISVISRHRGDRILDLVEQIRNRRDIAVIIRGQSTAAISWVSASTAR